jgi:hypothetical protein
MFCTKRTDNKTTFFLNCLIHIAILFIILTIFFLSYITSQEKKSYQKEIRNLFGKQIDQALNNNKYKNDLKKILQKIDLNDFIQKYSKEAEYVTINNKWLSSVCFCTIFFLCLLIICLFFILYYSCRLCTNVFEIMIENISIFVFVGCLEISFFLLIASKYVPVEPSLITNVLIQNLKNKVST